MMMALRTAVIPLTESTRQMRTIVYGEMMMNMLRSESSKEKLEKVAKDELESRMGNKQE